MYTSNAVYLKMTIQLNIKVTAEYTIVLRIYRSIKFSYKLIAHWSLVDFCFRHLFVLKNL